VDFSDSKDYVASSATPGAAKTCTEVLLITVRRFLLEVRVPAEPFLAFGGFLNEVKSLLVVAD
jgi:hypothetical protein